MSLTSYRAAPPRAGGLELEGREGLRAWRRPTLPHLLGAVPSARRVFTAEFGMGSGVWPLAMATRPAIRLSCGREKCLGEAAGPSGSRIDPGSCRYARRRSPGDRPWRAVPGVSSACRAISTGQLRGLRPFHLRPIDVVVFHGSRRDLVLRRVSRLDAFSGYPVRT